MHHGHRGGPPYLVSRAGGRGLGHQQPHQGVPSLRHLAVPRGHSEGHLLSGDPQFPGGEDRPICPDSEVHAAGLILHPLGPQTVAELDCKRRERGSGRGGRRCGRWARGKAGVVTWLPSRQQVWFLRTAGIGHDRDVFCQVWGFLSPPGEHGEASEKGTKNQRRLFDT